MSSGKKTEKVRETSPSFLQTKKGKKKITDFNLLNQGECREFFMRFAENPALVYESYILLHFREKEIFRREISNLLTHLKDAKRSQYLQIWFSMIEKQISGHGTHHEYFARDRFASAETKIKKKLNLISGRDKKDIEHDQNSNKFLQSPKKNYYIRRNQELNSDSSVGRVPKRDPLSLKFLKLKNL